MVVVIERDRRMARRLAAALEARGCTARVAHGYAQAKALLDQKVPAALYISEALHRESGGDLLADFERDERFAALPALVRVGCQDSVFARAMRRGGIRTIVAPFDVEAAAATLARMATAPGSSLRAILQRSRMLREYSAANRRRVEETAEQTRRIWRRIVRPD